MNLNPTNEVILDNFMDEEFHSVLFPLNLPCYFYLQPKYETLHGFVTPNRFYSALTSFAVWCIFIVINCYSTADYFISYELYAEKTFVFCTLPYFDLVTHLIYFIVIFTLVYTQSISMVNIITKLQRCHRTFRFVESKSLSDIKKSNWLSTISLWIGFHLTYNVTKFFFTETSVAHYIQLWTFAYLDVNTVYCACMINLLEYELRLWISELELFSKFEFPSATDDVAIFDAHCRKMLQAYADIITAFESFKQVFQVTIFLHITDNFMHTMFFIQMIIDMCKLDILTDKQIEGYNIIHKVIIIIWAVKNLIILVFIGAGCEKFYMTIDKADATCSILLRNEQLLDSLKIVCKNVSRVRVACFSRVSACGVFSVDAGLVLRLLQLVATYTVVLLQFAFLNKYS